jgi:hypothetical protein
MGGDLLEMSGGGMGEINKGSVGGFGNEMGGLSGMKQ